jgi:hypothetical protein
MDQVSKISIRDAYFILEEEQKKDQNSELSIILSKAIVGIHKQYLKENFIAKLPEENRTQCWDIGKLQRKIKYLENLVPKQEKIILKEETVITSLESFLDLFSLKHTFTKSFVFDGAFLENISFSLQEDYEPSSVEQITIH